MADGVLVVLVVVLDGVLVVVLDGVEVVVEVVVDGVVVVVVVGETAPTAPPFFFFAPGPVNGWVVVDAVVPVVPVCVLPVEVVVVVVLFMVVFVVVAPCPGLGSLLRWFVPVVPV